MGIHIIHLGKTWEKLMVAARIVVAIENPADIIVASQRPYGSRAVLKFSQYTGANPMAGRWMPGTLTNQITLVVEEIGTICPVHRRTRQAGKILVQWGVPTTGVHLQARLVENNNGNDQRFALTRMMGCCAAIPQSISHRDK